MRFDELHAHSGPVPHEFDFRNGSIGAITLNLRCHAPPLPPSSLQVCCAGNFYFTGARLCFSSLLVLAAHPHSALCLPACRGLLMGCTARHRRPFTHLRAW